jgi:hypothetical protein
MNLVAAYGLLAHGLIFGGLVSLLPLGVLRPHAALAGTTVALLAGIAPALHGLFGPPSVTLLILALLHLRQRPLVPLTYPAALVIVASAALFYPAALGWGSFDPYAVGYQPLPLLAALLPLGIVLCWRGQQSWLLILAAGLAAYAGGLFANLWDALLDPLLALLALGVVLREQAIRRIAARQR